MMGTETVPETLDFYELTRLSAREEFIKIIIDNVGLSIGADYSVYSSSVFRSLFSSLKQILLSLNIGQLKKKS
jgi:hypothetical protein